MHKPGNWRINLIFLFILLMGLALLGRLFFLQILNHKLYEAQALGQQAGFKDATGSRGEIFCRSSRDSKGMQDAGDVKSLAINKDEWTLSVTVAEVENKDDFAEKLAPLAGLAKEEIVSKLSSGDPFVTLKEGVSQENAKKIKDLRLKGLYLKQDTKRYYPQEKLASQVIGFLGGEGEGQYGVEGFYEQQMQGKSGISESKKGLNGLFDDDPASLNGADIYLTLDYNIQFEAETLLKKAKEDLDIASGQIIVMKPDTGKILAMAEYPGFNPNEYFKEKNLGVFQNGSVQKLFEPGSIMKPFTMAMALNEGKVTPNSTYVDTGELIINKKAIHNFAHEKYGLSTMSFVLQNSINTGAVYAQQSISHKTFFSYLEKFGFMKKTGIDLQSEAYSKNEILEKGPDVAYATASFGQGIELTPIQIAAGFCALANGGKVPRPYVVEKIVNGDDEQVTKPLLSDPVISRQADSDLVGMLVGVVDKGLTRIGRIPGYYLAGKTGTAEVPLVNGRGYDPDKTIQSFIGFGPAYNPQFLIMVKLDNPHVAKSALSAVPVFKKLAQYIINYWQIPPDFDEKAEVKK